MEEGSRGQEGQGEIMKKKDGVEELQDFGSDRGKGLAANLHKETHKQDPERP